MAGRPQRRMRRNASSARMDQAAEGLWDHLLGRSGQNLARDEEGDIWLFGIALAARSWRAESMNIGGPHSLVWCCDPQGPQLLPLVATGDWDWATRGERAGQRKGKYAGRVLPRTTSGREDEEPTPMEGAQAACRAVAVGRGPSGPFSLREMAQALLQEGMLLSLELPGCFLPPIRNVRTPMFWEPLLEFYAEFG